MVVRLISTQINFLTISYNSHMEKNILSDREKSKLNLGIFAFTTGLLPMLTFTPLIVLSLFHQSVSMLGYQIITGCFYTALFLTPIIVGYYYKIKPLIYSTLVPLLFFVTFLFCATYERENNIGILILLIQSILSALALVLGLVSIAWALWRIRRHKHLLARFIFVFLGMFLSALVLLSPLFIPFASATPFMKTMLKLFVIAGLSGIILSSSALIFLGYYILRKLS